MLGAPITQPHSCDAEAFGSIRWHSEAFRKKYSMLRHITSTSISTNSAFLTSLNKQSRPRLATCVLRPASCVLLPTSLQRQTEPCRFIYFEYRISFPVSRLLTSSWTRSPPPFFHPSSTLLPPFSFPTPVLPAHAQVSMPQGSMPQGPSPRPSIGGIENGLDRRSLIWGRLRSTGDGEVKLAGLLRVCRVWREHGQEAGVWGGCRDVTIQVMPVALVALKL